MAGSLVTDTIVVRIKGDIDVVVPSSIAHMSTYVLLEQEDWMEQEMNFVRTYVVPGTCNIDIGANYGVYTLVMAKHAGPSGRVIAFEPACETAACLKESISRNNNDNIILFQSALSDRTGTAHLALHAGQSELNCIFDAEEAVQQIEEIVTETLDNIYKRMKWKDLHFIKLDAEGHEVNVVQGGKRCLSELSPLIMFELRHVDKVNTELLQKLQKLDYSLFRYVPGLNILAPVKESGSHDAYQLNLFACKEDRARQMEEEGLLARTESAFSIEPVTGSWREWVRNRTYARDMKSHWEKAAENNTTPAWLRYQLALDHYVAAYAHSPDPASSYAHLIKAKVLMQELIESNAGLERMLTFIRILLDCGERMTAIINLRKLIQSYSPRPNMKSNEPFLPLSRRFETISAGARVAAWCAASLYEAYERNYAYSSYYSGRDALQFLDAVINTGFGDNQTAKRLHLIHRRFDIKAKPVLEGLLKKEGKDNLNADYWKKLLC